jgi:peptidoglycan/LPS O-acetylase OafA/YrhL
MTATLETSETRLALPARIVDSEPSRIGALDGLRGVAVSLVLLHHFPHVQTTGLAQRWASYVIDNLWCGVDLFFVLSGFLITGVLLRTRNQPHYLRNFYARRSLRIFPLAFLMLGICFLLAATVPATRGAFGEAFENQAWWWLYGVNLFITRANSWVGGELNHFWTLAIEEQFYLAWPLVVLLSGRRGVVVASAILLAAAPAFRWWMTMVELCPGNHIFTFARVDGLAAGALLAIVPTERLRSVRGQRYAWIAAIGGFAGVVCLVWTLNRPLLFVDPFAVPVFTLLAVGFAAVVALAMSSPLVAAMLSLAPLRGLGTISYGIYILHLPLRPLINPIAQYCVDAVDGNFWIGTTIRFTVACAITIPVAWMSWRLIETPFLRLKRRFASPDQPGKIIAGL